MIFQADMVFQAAFKSAAHIIVRGSEDHNRFKTELGSFLEGGFHQLFAIAHSLILGINADRTEGKNGLFFSIWIDQPGFCIHDISNDLAIQLKNQVQLREKIFVISDDMCQIVFMTAGNIQVPEGFPCECFYGFIIVWLLCSNGNGLLHDDSSFQAARCQGVRPAAAASREISGMPFEAAG